MQPCADHAGASAPLQMKDTSYSPMRATNPHSGARQLVLLMPADELAQLAVVPSQLELRADLASALAVFSRPYRRVLFKVLVQGQSIELATARNNKSSVWWRRWFREIALPTLRHSLADYFVEGKVVL